MIVTAWILFVVFGFFAVVLAYNYMFHHIPKVNIPVMILSIIIAAISAGIIWGGLKIF
jgi:hypothetical protein